MEISTSQHPRIQPKSSTHDPGHSDPVQCNTARRLCGRGRGPRRSAPTHPSIAHRSLLAYLKRSESTNWCGNRSLGELLAMSMKITREILLISRNRPNTEKYADSFPATRLHVVAQSVDHSLPDVFVHSLRQTEVE